MRRDAMLVYPLRGTKVGGPKGIDIIVHRDWFVGALVGIGRNGL